MPNTQRRRRKTPPALDPTEWGFEQFILELEYRHKYSWIANRYRQEDVILTYTHAGEGLWTLKLRNCHEPWRSASTDKLRAKLTELKLVGLLP